MHNIQRILCLVLFLLPTMSADVIRLASVVEIDGLGITRHEFGEGENPEILFVEDKAIVTEADVVHAILSPSREDAIDIGLSKAGTEKMIAATKIMRPGIDRIAIIVNGKIVSAPVLQSVPLGKHFIISGLKEKNEAMNLAARLSGKSDLEIVDELAVIEQGMRDRPPLPEPVFHTEEEYQKLKAERDKVGLHYMDRLYSEAELDGLLKPGMKKAEVTGIFGKPQLRTENEDGTVRLKFETAPERRPETPEYHMGSFRAHFESGKLIEWRAYGWSHSTRAPKPPERPPGNLIFKTPPADMSSEDFDYMAFYEAHEISLKPGKNKPTVADYYDLIGVLWGLSGIVDEGQTIDSQCDIIQFLVPAVPDLGALVKKSAQGRIAINEINEILKAFVLGEKELE